jgi:hypothetical protein
MQNYSRKPATARSSRHSLFNQRLKSTENLPDIKCDWCRCGGSCPSFLKDYVDLDAASLSPSLISFSQAPFSTQVVSGIGGFINI